MKQLQRLLVATDLSTPEDNAVQRGALLARQSGAAVELLHVLEDWPRGELPPLDSPLMTELRQTLTEAAQGSLRQLAGQWFDGIDVRCRVEVGRDFAGIIGRARQFNADLVVVGTGGGHSARELFLGTTAEKVVRKGDRSVLLVRHPPRKPYRRVLIPTDFSPASRQALIEALSLAPGARFDLLHVYRLWGSGRLGPASIGDEQLQRYQQQLLDAAGTKLQQLLQIPELHATRIKRHLRQGNPAALIPAQAAELGADLIAMGTAGLSGLPYLLLGSVTEQVIRQASCDVLAVRPADFKFQLP